MAEKRFTVSGIAYKIKDWVTIFSAIIWLVMYVNTFASIPKRVIKLETEVSLLHDDSIKMNAGVAYLVKRVDEIAPPARPLGGSNGTSRSI